MTDNDWDAVLRIYCEGIDTRNATFATEVPSREYLDGQWLPKHCWVATIDDAVVGWAALSPVSGPDCYCGVAENSVYVADGMCGRVSEKRCYVHRSWPPPMTGSGRCRPRSSPRSRFHLTASFRWVSYDRDTREDRSTRRSAARHRSPRTAINDRVRVSSLDSGGGQSWVGE